MSFMSSADQLVLSGFTSYLKVEKGLSPLSVEAYRRDLTQFSDHLQKNRRGLANARREDVRGFLDQLFAHAADARTVARKLSALRGFYRYLLLDHGIDRDPTLNIELPKQWKVLPKSLARDEVGNMLAGRPVSSARNQQSLALELRDQAMLEMLYGAALRVSELVGVEIQDVKLELGYVLVRGKGETVLAVEDNASLRRVVARQLTELGYRVLEAEDAQTALRILESEAIDLLFTDIVMPGGTSGYEIAGRVLARWPRIKVVLTSGFPENRTNCDLNARGLRLLSKPYRRDDLGRMIREALDS